jgi:hypothetical protein
LLPSEELKVELSLAFFKNSEVPDLAIVPKFFANSSLDIPIPVSLMTS